MDSIFRIFVLIMTLQRASVAQLFPFSLLVRSVSELISLVLLPVVPSVLYNSSRKIDSFPGSNDDNEICADIEDSDG